MLLILSLLALVITQEVSANSNEKIDDDWFSKNANVTGFIHQPYVETNGNKVPEQGLKGTEIGLRVDLNLGRMLTARSLISYLPSKADSKPTEPVFALLDYHNGKGRFDVGFRTGILEMPFSLHSSRKNSPRDRLSPLQNIPNNMIWPYQNTLFSSMVGWQTYSGWNFDNLRLTVEYGRGDRSLKHEDQLNYVQELDGITAVHQEVSRALQVDLIGDIYRFRIVSLGMETVFNVSDEHWSGYLSDKAGFSIPESMWVTGDMGVQYGYEYAGGELWFHENFALLVEQIFFNYTGQGSAKEYYDAIGSELRKDTNIHQNFMLLYHQNCWDGFTGFGRNYYNSRNDIKHEYYAGLSYLINQYKLSSLIQHSDHTGWLLWSENPNKPNVGDGSKLKQKWSLYAIAITYSF